MQIYYRLGVPGLMVIINEHVDRVSHLLFLHSHVHVSGRNRGREIC